MIIYGECSCWVCCPEEYEEAREPAFETLRFTRRRTVRARKRYNKWRHRPEYLRSLRYDDGGTAFGQRISYEFGGPGWECFT